jgi:hypothetical protein
LLHYLQQIGGDKTPNKSVAPFCCRLDGRDLSSIEAGEPVPF